jgi:ribonuclease HI
MGVIVYTDGGARGNPGPAGAGVVIIDGDPSTNSGHGKTLAEVKAYLGDKQTNNWAEYEAVVIALGKLLEMNLRDTDIEFRLDSLLVVEQLMGNWKIKEPELKKQVTKVRSLLKDFGKVTFTHIPREENSEADRLVNEALDESA